MQQWRLVFFLFIISGNFLLSVAQTDNPILAAIKKEVDRNFNELKMDGYPSPFFISYAITDLHHLKVTASFGAVAQSFEIRERIGLPLVLVGDYRLNNLKYEYNYRPQYKISLDNDPKAIGISIWTDLDDVYKQAVRNYESKKGILSQTRLTAEEQALSDYEQTPVVNLILPPEKTNMDRIYWETYARTASAIAQKYPDIANSQVTVTLQNRMNYYYDTAGSQYAVPYIGCHLEYMAWIMNGDGEMLSGFVHYCRSSTDSLPCLSSFIDDCEQKINSLLKLKSAVKVEKTYTGPILFETKELVQLFDRNLLNNNLSAFPKLSNGNGGNNLEVMTGEKIISDQLTVKALSGTKIYNGQVLDGYYPIDGEGVVPPEELILIENGVLKNMLSNRIPTVKNQHSNGHYRLTFGAGFRRNISPGIIQITGKNVYADTDMKQELIKAARKTGLEYAYIINDNGTTRVYTEDGREELIRGITYVSDINTNNRINLFRKILAVSDKEFIHSINLPSALYTYIIPASMLFEEADLIKVNERIDFNVPVIIPKPTE